MALTLDDLADLIFDNNGLTLLDSESALADEYSVLELLVALITGLKGKVSKGVSKRRRAVLGIAREYSLFRRPHCYDTGVVHIEQSLILGLDDSVRIQAQVLVVRVRMDVVVAGTDKLGIKSKGVTGITLDSATSHRHDLQAVGTRGTADSKPRVNCDLDCEGRLERRKLRHGDTKWAE